MTAVLVSLVSWTNGLRTAGWSRDCCLGTANTRCGGIAAVQNKREAADSCVLLVSFHFLNGGGGLHSFFPFEATHNAHITERGTRQAWSSASYPQHLSADGNSENQPFITGLLNNKTSLHQMQLRDTRCEDNRRNAQRARESWFKGITIRFLNLASSYWCPPDGAVSNLIF